MPVILPHSIMDGGRLEGESELEGLGRAFRWPQLQSIQVNGCNWTSQVKLQRYLKNKWETYEAELESKISEKSDMFNNINSITKSYLSIFPIDFKWISCSFIPCEKLIVSYLRSIQFRYIFCEIVLIHNIY